MSNFKKLFNFYEKVNFFPSPAYKNVLNNNLGYVKTKKPVRDEEVFDPFPGEGMFEDFEKVTYFYDFSKQDLNKLVNYSSDGKMRHLGIFTGDYRSDSEVKKDTNGALLSRFRLSVEGTIGSQLDSLLNEGKNVTHFVCAEETYEGYDDFPVWRTHEKADIYEVK